MKNNDPSGGKAPRVFALEFAALVVERRVPNSAKFNQLWQAMDPGGMLKKMLASNPLAMSVDGTNFFDGPRMDVINPGGETCKSCGLVFLTHEELNVISPEGSHSSFLV